MDLHLVSSLSTRSLSSRTIINPTIFDIAFIAGTASKSLPLAREVVDAVSTLVDELLGKGAQLPLDFPLRQLSLYTCPDSIKGSWLAFIELHLPQPFFNVESEVSENTWHICVMLYVVSYSPMCFFTVSDFPFPSLKPSFKPLYLPANMPFVHESFLTLGSRFALPCTKARNHFNNMTVDLSYFSDCLLRWVVKAICTIGINLTVDDLGTEIHWCSACCSTHFVYLVVHRIREVQGISNPLEVLSFYSVGPENVRSLTTPIWSLFFCTYCPEFCVSFVLSCIFSCSAYVRHKSPGEGKFLNLSPVSPVLYSAGVFDSVSVWIASTNGALWCLSCKRPNKPNRRGSWKIAVPMTSYCFMQSPIDIRQRESITAISLQATVSD